MSTAVVWFRRDLRVHDHPPLVTALEEHDEVVPLFVLDERLIHGRFASANRTQYLLDCLKALDGELRERGAVRHGRFETEIAKLVEETGAECVYAAGDVSAYARARGKKVGDMGSNNGGWQWVAGTGTDPQDYTRVFNPTLQQERFDPDGEYVRRWVPELDTPDYPKPIVDHAQERKRAIADYREART